MTAGSERMGGGGSQILMAFDLWGRRGGCLFITRNNFRSTNMKFRDRDHAA